MVAASANCHAARRCLEAMLHDRFGLEHTTLQIDHEGGQLISIEEAPAQQAQQAQQAQHARRVG